MRMSGMLVWIIAVRVLEEFLAHGIALSMSISCKSLFGFGVERALQRPVLDLFPGQQPGQQVGIIPVLSSVKKMVDPFQLDPCVHHIIVRGALHRAV